MKYRVLIGMGGGGLGVLLGWLDPKATPFPCGIGGPPILTRMLAIISIGPDRQEVSNWQRQFAVIDETFLLNNGFAARVGFLITA